jgi:hypothetical protein
VAPGFALGVLSLNSVNPWFLTWVDIGDVELTERLLAMDPSSLRQTETREEPLFTKALLRGHREEADLLYRRMQKQHIALPLLDQWARKALKKEWERQQPILAKHGFMDKRHKPFKIDIKNL